MSSPEPTTLSEALSTYGSYPDDHPQTLAELVAAEPDTISHPLAWFLRKQTTGATRAAERHHVHGPDDVLKLLRNGYALHVWEGAWRSYALSGERQVVLQPDDKGTMRSLCKATRLLPKADELPEIPRSAYRGRKKPGWLVLFGGNPEVLSREHVTQGLATLQRKTAVADICFYECDPDRGIAPTLWSVRAGVGVTSTGGPGGTEVPFPDPQKLEEVRNYERHHRSH